MVRASQTKSRVIWPHIRIKTFFVQLDRNLAFPKAFFFSMSGLSQTSVCNTPFYSVFAYLMCLAGVVLRLLIKSIPGLASTTLQEVVSSK
jgi:hypothetical protein